MPTIRQKKLAEIIVENATLDKPLNKGEMLSKVGYAPNVAKHRPSAIMESEGVIEALEDLGFTETNAKKVVSEIMLNEAIDPTTRLRATDQVFKVHGSYNEPEGGGKTLIVVVSGESIKRYAIPITSDTERSST